MPSPAAEEARTLDDAELAQAINDAYRERFNLQFQKGTRQLQDSMAIRRVGRQIARLRTVQRERQLASAAGAPLPSRCLICSVSLAVRRFARVRMRLIPRT